MTVPAAIVEPPSREPRQHGLFSAVQWRDGGLDGESSDRWEHGVVTQQADPLTVEGRGGPSCDPVTGLPKTLNHGLGRSQADSFAVYQALQCTPVGDQGMQAAAAAALQASEQHRVEQAFWTGDLGNTPNLSGANGYPAPTALAAATSPTEAVALLTEWAADHIAGRPVIHAGAATVLALIDGGPVKVRSGQLVTELGAPVVAGAGYPEGTLVVTGQIAGYRGQVLTSSGRSGDLLDKGQNTMTWLAERMFLLLVDDLGGAASVAWSYGA